MEGIAKIYEMLDLQGVNIIPDETVSLYEMDLHDIRINPNLEMNETTLKFFLHLMQDRGINSIQEYFEYQMRSFWNKHLLRMAKQDFGEDDVQLLSDLLTKMVDEDCPECILGSVYRNADPDNIILKDKLVRIRTYMGQIDGLWDTNLRKYVPTRNANEKGMVTKLYNDASGEIWKNDIVHLLETATVNKAQFVGCGNVGIAQIYRNQFRLTNPLYVNPINRSLMLIIPIFDVRDRQVRILVNGFGTDSWRLTSEEDSGVITLQGVGLVKKGKSYDTSFKKSLTGRLPKELRDKEMTKLLEGTTDNYILRHVDVVKLPSDIYHLSCQDSHLFIRQITDGVELLAGVTPYKDGKVIKTTDPKLVEEIERELLLYKLGQ